MNYENANQAAEILLAVRRDTKPIKNLPELFRPEDLDASYNVQDLLNRKLSSSGFGERVGYKIGCTTTVMQEYLGIPHPCAGTMFASLVKHVTGDFSRSSLCRPGVECEVAVQIGRDMISGVPFSADLSESYVSHAMASIELVDDRWTDYKIVSTPSLISENFFNAGCVLGPPQKVSGSILKDIEGTMSVNGDPVGSGSTKDILGNPFEALAWLANHQTKRGAPIRAGDYVTLGSVVKTQWIDLGDIVEIEFKGLGRCSLRMI